MISECSLSLPVTVPHNVHPAGTDRGVALLALLGTGPVRRRHQGLDPGQVPLLLTPTPPSPTSLFKSRTTGSYRLSPIPFQ